MYQKNVTLENVVDHDLISRLALEIVVIALGKRQGWFDLDLQGTETQIQNGLNYLQELKLQVWDENSISDW
ncbi:hypothetical protein BMF77_03693 [Dolichospermum sp. UHCC 0315A]|uniref:NIL domain-containing protein n=1 Tax=Dolichospermum sp. UHCC 0315A TaxID=1914871 RepID=UPI0011E7E163|nr:hypothetical protein BMF77_03693 [Dolichospermum sp. UHCC 0315A]